MGQAKSKVVRDAIDKLIREAGGKPFDCDAFPNSDQCKNDLGEWASEAWERLEAAVTYCSTVCVGLEFQGGNLQFVVGFGGGGLGASVVWHTRGYSEQGAAGVMACGAAGIGVCAGYGPTVDSNGEWGEMYYSAGVALGNGVVEPIVSYTVVSFDFATRKVTWPQNPFPPSVCSLAWWLC